MRKYFQQEIQEGCLDADFCIYILLLMHPCINGRLNDRWVDNSR